MGCPRQNSLGTRCHTHITTQMATIAPNTQELNYDCLPFDILCLVFEFLSAEGPLHLRGALFVCKSWYFAGVLSPQLWTNVVIDGIFINHFTCHANEAGSAFLLQCVKRSQSRPLRMRWIFTGLANPVSGNNPQNQLETETVIASITKLIITLRDAGAFDRCTSLEWEVDFFASGDWTTPLLPVELPVLRRLFVINLYTSDAPYKYMQFPKCPQLRDIIMSNYTEFTPYFCKLESEEVESLVFHNGSEWYSEDRSIISRFTSLRSLVLGTGLDEPCRHYPASYSPTYVSRHGAPDDFCIRLPLLTSLHVHGFIPGPVLEELDVPSLLSLRITAESTRGDHSLGLISEAPLRHFPRDLYVSLEPLREGSDEWLDDLVNVVESMNSLTVLHVSSPIAERLKKRSWRNVTLVVESSSYKNVVE